jgi:hypothetical protein
MQQLEWTQAAEPRPTRHPHVSYDMICSCLPGWPRNRRTGGTVRGPSHRESHPMSAPPATPQDKIIERAAEDDHQRYTPSTCRDYRINCILYESHSLCNRRWYRRQGDEICSSGTMDHMPMCTRICWYKRDHSRPSAHPVLLPPVRDVAHPVAQAEHVIVDQLRLPVVCEVADGWPAGINIRAMRFCITEG